MPPMSNRVKISKTKIIKTGYLVEYIRKNQYVTTNVVGLLFGIGYTHSGFNLIKQNKADPPKDFSFITFEQNNLETSNFV